MKYIDIDPVTREVNWDRYFEYLRSVEPLLPDGLKRYAMDWAHYSLESEETLHDAWLTSIDIGSKDRTLVLEFLGPRHDRRHLLQYVEVQKHILELHVEYQFGDRNVFVHEFRLEGSSLVHEIV